MGMKAALLKSAFSRSVSSVAETMKDVVQDGVEDVARNVGRWAKGTAILYGIGAGLILVALTGLCHGLAELLIAAGLPPFAGYLIVAVVAGVAGYLLFKAGAGRHVTPRPKGEPEQFRIRIVTPRAPRREVIDVRHSRRHWEVRGPRTERRQYRSRESAVRAARRSARSRHGRVVIHVPNGRSSPS
jgi:hypothetical protein